MAYEYADDAHIVAATKDGWTQYWAAATVRSAAVEAVRRMIAPGWELVLTNHQLPTAKAAELNIRPNTVRKLKRFSTR
jgi:hypothetical protein